MELETRGIELLIKRKESYRTDDKKGVWSKNLIFVMEEKFENMYVSQGGDKKGKSHLESCLSLSHPPPGPPFS